MPQPLPGAGLESGTHAIARRGSDVADDPAVELDKELDFATLAIAHRVLTREQVETAQKSLERENKPGKPPRILEEYLLEKGVLRSNQVWAVYKARERLLRDARSKGERIGGYEVIAKVGEGGLGVVYKARQLSMGRLVALKVLHERWVGDDEFRKRFLVEARLVGRLSHPNLVQVIDVGRHRNTLFYSMEFVDGETVEARLDREGRLAPLAAFRIAIQVAKALQYLHQRKIVHRDVKPGNIMLTRAGVAKLGDFGFVMSSLESVLSTDGEVLGTPDYISPEAAQGERKLDFRSDLYSLGATLYHMLGGRPPFGGGASDVMEAHVKTDPEPLGNLQPELPARVLGLVERLMRKKPDDRYRLFDELMADLETLRYELEPTRDALEDDDAGAGAAAIAADRIMVDSAAFQKMREREAWLIRRALRLRNIGLAAGLGWAITAAAFIAWLCWG